MRTSELTKEEGPDDSSEPLFQHTPTDIPSQSISCRRELPFVEQEPFLDFFPVDILKE